MAISKVRKNKQKTLYEACSLGFVSKFSETKQTGFLSSLQVYLLYVEWIGLPDKYGYVFLFFWGGV